MVVSKKGKQLNMKNNLITDIEKSVQYLLKHEKTLKRKDYGDWEGRFLKETEIFITKEGHIKKECLETFRGRQIFVRDKPTVKFIRKIYIDNPLYYKFVLYLQLIIGKGRGNIRQALNIYECVKEANCLDLLKKYPSPEIGKPLNLCYKEFKFTFRYIRHIYNLGLFRKHLSKLLVDDFISMDIGSSYGIFSSLLKSEYKKSHHVLVDLPGQLILANYYLKRLFPEAKIADFSDVGNAVFVDRNFIKNFDFILVSADMYHKIKGTSVDLITNFSSLSEMPLNWFETYLKSDPFITSPYLFTINRYDAYPTYIDNITILDYELHKYETIYMRTLPFLKWRYPQKNLFWYTFDRYPSELFQFIGKRK
jgi:hypothetical protein